MKTTVKLISMLVVFFLVSCETHDNYPSFSEDLWEGMPYNEKYKEYEENPFLKVSEFPQSTFSIDADGASYANMRRFV